MYRYSDLQLNNLEACTHVPKLPQRDSQPVTFKLNIHKVAHSATIWTGRGNGMYVSLWSNTLQ